MEKVIKPVNGYSALLGSVVLLAAGAFCIMQTATNNNPVLGIAGAICILGAVFIWKGLLIVQPNTARVLNLFGKYVGSVKDNGMFFVNPLNTARPLSQRVQNLATPTLKVNDKMGNPVEIASVIVWYVEDTYKAAY